MKHIVMTAALSLGLCLCSFGQVAVPQTLIVAQKSYQNETATLAATLFTPTSDQSFRVNAYVEIFGTVSGSTYLYSTLNWTDDIGAEPQPGQTTPSLTYVGPYQSYGQGSFMVRAKANTPITVTFGQNGNLSLPPGGSYSAYVSVEQISR